MTNEGSWKETSARFKVNPAPNWVFVFGSNLAGRHGLGAAKFAKMHYGAQYGKKFAVGHVGRSYAIPTKGEELEVLCLDVIAIYCKDFVSYAKSHPLLTFELTPVGCGLAGYKDQQVAPLFQGLPENVIVPDRWKKYIGKEKAAKA